MKFSKPKFSFKQFFQTNRKKKIAVIVLGAIILLGIISIAFVLSKNINPITRAICENKYNKITEEIKAANYCEQDDECASVNFPCPILMNKAKLVGFTKKNEFISSIMQFSNAVGYHKI
jgi:hypothetical protein